MSGVLPNPRKLGCPRAWTERLDTFRFAGTESRYDRARLVYDWTRWKKKPSAGFIVEKSPPDTLRSVWLQDVFGECYFVGIVRSGYAVSEGIRRRNGYSIDRCARHWNLANKIMLEDAAWLEHFMLLKYEELVEEPLRAVRSLARWLGIEFEPFGEVTEKDFVTHHTDSTPSRITDFNAKCIARLSEEDKQVITREASDMLERLGYLPRA